MAARRIQLQTYILNYLLTVFMILYNFHAMMVILTCSGNDCIVTWMAQQEVGGHVNSVDSRGDVTYPHSFHQYTTLGKHSPPAVT
jgi:hypothetical protein